MVLSMSRLLFASDMCGRSDAAAEAALISARHQTALAPLLAEWIASIALHYQAEHPAIREIASLSEKLCRASRTMDGAPHPSI